jgi:hypothetical protein
MRWKGGWKERTTPTQLLMQVNQKRHSYFNGYPQANRAGISNCQTERPVSARKQPVECQTTEKLLLTKSGQSIIPNIERDKCTMKAVILTVLCLSPLVSFADPDTYEVAIEVNVGDARLVLSTLNERLNLKFNDKEFADFAESLRQGHNYSIDFDMHFEGIVFTATYQIAKPESGRVELSFSSFQERATTAICEEMARFSRKHDATHSPVSCHYQRPEKYEI